MADPLSSPLDHLNKCTTALTSWFLFNGLQLNPSKSEVILVGSKAKCRSALSSLGFIISPDDSLTTGVNVAGSFVPLLSSTKILGVTFDSALSFDIHISEICRVANFHLRALSHIRQYLTTSSANLIACSIVGSRLDYCNALFSGLSAYNIHRLQLVQNRAARIVLGVGRRVSAEPLLRELHWLPICKRIQFKVAILTFKVVTTKQPSYLSSLLVPYVPTRNLRSLGNNLLVVPKIDSVFQSRAFSYAAPHLWNSLPGSLRGLADLSPCQ
jgi:hypothetical protein